MEGKLKKQLPVRTQMVWYLLATVLILVAGGLRALDRGMYNSFWSVWLQLLRHMIHIGLLIGWMISIQSRILQRPVRRYLLAIGCMLSFWLFVRASKWMLFAHDSRMNRYCWYSYYIPMVLVPLLAGMLLPHIGQSERYRPGKRRRLWYIPAVALMGLVLTNDLHQLVFRFPDGIVFLSEPVYIPDRIFCHFCLVPAVGNLFCRRALAQVQDTGPQTVSVASGSGACRGSRIVSCVYFTSVYF